MRSESRHPRCRRSAQLIGLVLALATLGCAPGTRTVVHEGLFQLEQDKQTLYDLVPEVAIEKAAQELARGLLEGSLDTLTDEQRKKQVRALVHNFVSSVEKELEAAGVGELGDKAHDTVVRTVEDSVSAALSSGNRVAASRLGRSVAKATTDTLLSSLSTGWEEELGPAIAGSFQRDFGPALQEALHTNITPEVALMARTSGRELLNGVSESVDGPLGDALDERFFKPLKETLKQGESTATRWIFFLVIALVTLVVLMTGIAVYFGSVWRRELGTSSTRRDTIRLLTEAISNTSRDGSIEQMLEELKRLRTHSERADAYAELERVLGEHAHLRLRRKQEEAEAADR